jgi:hypothetical protein
MAEVESKEETTSPIFEAVLMGESSEKGKKSTRRKRKLKPPAEWGKIKRSLIEKAVKEVRARHSQT